MMYAYEHQHVNVLRLLNTVPLLQISVVTNTLLGQASTQMTAREMHLPGQSSANRCCQ